MPASPAPRYNFHLAEHRERAIASAVRAVAMESVVSGHDLTPARHAETALRRIKPYFQRTFPGRAETGSRARVRKTVIASIGRELVEQVGQYHADKPVDAYRATPTQVRALLLEEGARTPGKKAKKRVLTRIVKQIGLHAGGEKFGTRLARRYSLLLGITDRAYAFYQKHTPTIETIPREHQELLTERLSEHARRCTQAEHRFTGDLLRHFDNHVNSAIAVRRSIRDATAKVRTMKV